MNTLDLNIVKERLTTLQILNDKFGITDYLMFKAGRENLPVVEISNDHAVATVSLQGGLVMSFRPRDQDPVLWLSSLVPMDKNKPIRGGIPLCWPWFGPHESDKTKPAHGFARNAEWQVSETKRIDNEVTQLVLELVKTPALLGWWPGLAQVQLQLVVTVGAELTVALVTSNHGAVPLVLSEGLHTYFQVGEVTKIALHGLENVEYIDKMDNSQRKSQVGAVTIGAQTDRVYVNTAADCIIEDPVLKRQIRLAKQGSNSTVVWNPWATQAVQLGDVGYQGFLKMLCVEAANTADNVVTVPPGEKHSLVGVISVVSQNK